MPCAGSHSIPTEAMCRTLFHATKELKQKFKREGGNQEFFIEIFRALIQKTKEIFLHQSLSKLEL